MLLRRANSTPDLLAALQDEGEATRPAAKWDPRLYGIGAQILRDLGVRRMKLLASPRKMPSMAGFQLEITGYLNARRSEGINLCPGTTTSTSSSPT